MAGAWPQILIIKCLIILSVCFAIAIAVDPETLESRSSAKSQLPTNRSKRQGSRSYNDYWHYLIDKQAYFADEHLAAHKPCGPYKPYDMHVLPPYGLHTHSSEEDYDHYADSLHPNVDIIPDFGQPPTAYNGFGVQPNLFSALGMNIHPRSKAVSTKRPMTYSDSSKNPPRKPNCTTNRCHSVTKPKLCYQSHRRPRVKGNRNCTFPLQRCRKTKCGGVCQQNGTQHCNLNAANQISSQNSTHIVVMHLGENNCTCTHYIKKAKGVSDFDSRLEIKSEKILDDSTSIPVATTKGITLNSTATSAAATIVTGTKTSSALDSDSSTSPTSDSQSSSYLSASTEPALNTNVSHRPSTTTTLESLSTSTKSPSEENIVLDSSSSIPPKFNSSVRHRPSNVSTLGSFNTTPRSNSKEDIVLDSTSSTTVHSSSPKTVNVGTTSSDESAPTSTPSASYKYLLTSEGNDSTLKTSSFNSFETFSAAGINTSSTENIASEFLDSSTRFTVPSTNFPISPNSSTLSSINSSDSDSGTISSNTVYTATKTKSIFNSTSMIATTPTPSLMTTKLFASDLRPDSTLSSASTQSPKTPNMPSLASTSSPRPDSTFSHPPSFPSKLIPKTSTETTPRPASTTSYTLVSIPDAESGNVPLAMDSDFKINSTPRNISLSNTKDTTFDSSSKLTRLVLHQNTSSISHSSVVTSNTSSSTKSAVLSKDSQNLTAHGKGPLLSSMHTADELSSGKDRLETTHGPMVHVTTSTSALPTEQELRRSHNKDGRVISSSTMASKSSIDETLAVSKQTNMTAHVKEGRVISSVISRPTILKEDFIDDDLESSSEKNNRNSKHHDSERIPIKVDDVSSTFVLSTDQESNTARVKNERVVQSSFASSSAISKAVSTGDDLGAIALTTKQGSRIIHNKGESVRNSSEKDNRNSKHHDSARIPIKVDNVSSTFVLSTEQEFNTARVKDERVVQSSFASSSAISKAVSTGDDLGAIALTTKQGSRTSHNKGGRLESSIEKDNRNSRHDDSVPTPIQVDDVSSTFILSSEHESNTARIKNERVVQSAVASPSAISKANSTDDDLRAISKLKDNVPSTTVLSTKQESRTVHNKGGRLESSSEKDNRNSRHDDSVPIPIHVDDVSSTFVLSTEQKSSAAHIKNERVVQSSFASSSTISKADYSGDDLGAISKHKDNMPSTTVLSTKQGPRTIHNKGGRVESSDSETIPIHVDDVSTSFVLSTEQESAKTQIKNERIVQSSFASSSAISKNHSAGNDLKSISNFKQDIPSTIVLSPKQGSRTIHNKDGRLESSSEKDNRNWRHDDSVPIPIHVDDVSSTFMLSTDQESLAPHIKNERIVQSSFASSSAISKAIAIDDDLGPISKHKDNVPSTTVLSTKQGSRTIHNKGGRVESSDTETIPIHVDDVSTSFVLSTEQESAKAQIKNERIVQSSFASSSAISKNHSAGNDLKSISNFKKDIPSTIVLSPKQGSRTVHNKGGMLESSSEEDNRNSKHHDSEPIPITVDDVSSTFVLSTEQESSKAQIKNERIVQSSLASSSAISKADSTGNNLKSISNFKDDTPSTIVLSPKQGPRTIPNKGGRIESFSEKDNRNSRYDDSEMIPIHVDDVSSTFVLSTEQKSSKAQNKNEKIVQSSFASSSTISKADSTGNDIKSISNFKDDIPSTIVLSPKQGPRTIHNKEGRLESSSEKDNRNSKHRDSGTIPIHVDDVSSTLVLSTEQESAKAPIINERVVQSSFASSSTISKADSTGKDIKSISNFKQDIPSTIVLSPKEGSRTVHNKGGRLESSSEKDNINSKHHDSEPIPITVDDVSSTFVLSTEQESSKAQIKNERIVQSSFASSSSISKADSTGKDIKSISNFKQDISSTIVLPTKQGPRTIHNKGGRLESSSEKDNRDSKHRDSKTIPIHVDDVSSTFVLSAEQESAKAPIKNERVVQSSFASSSTISKADSTNDDLEPILKLKGDVPGTIELSTKQGSRTVYNKVGREESSSKEDNRNSNHKESEPIPIKEEDVSSSFVLSGEQESTKAQIKNERVVQSSFASSAAISKKDFNGNDLKAISNFKDNIPNTNVLPQIAANQPHQQFGRMDLVAQLHNLEKINQSSQFITNSSSSATRNSSWETKTTSLAQSSNERNILKSRDWQNVPSNKKRVEEQQMKILQAALKETETLKSHRDNKMAAFTRVSDINSKDRKSKGLRADDIETLVIGGISAIDLASSDHIFSHELSEAETLRENNPTVNGDEKESTQILSSSLVRDIGEGDDSSDDGSNVALNSNGNFRALQFGSAASRIDSENVKSRKENLELAAGRSRDNINDRYKASARLTSQSFDTLEDSKENDQDSEEIDPKDVPKTASGLKAECATSAESGESISDTLKLETENVGDRRNYVSGTGSRFVQVLRTPNERYSYYSSAATFAEPLVPGVYTTKRNEFKYKSRYPTTIYWRRIEPKPCISNSRLRELRPFESDDYEDARASQDCYDIDLIDC